MSKETFTREKPHLNIATIGGGAVLLILIILGASTLFRGQQAPTAPPTDTPAPGPISAPTNTSQGSASGSLTVNQLWGDWFIYQDMCGGSITTLQTTFTLRNDGAEPLSLPSDTLLLTFFGPPDPDSEEGLPEYVQIFILPHFLKADPQNEPGSLPPGNQIQVVLEISPSHPDFLWNPRNPILPTAAAADGPTFYGRYVIPDDSASSSAGDYTFYGRYVGAARSTSNSAVPAATLLLPYFEVSTSSSASSGPNQLWGDYFYLDVDSGSAQAAGQLWGDYQYLDVANASSGFPSAPEFKDVSIAVMLLPDVPGLFKDTADGETASASNIVLKRGYTADLDTAGDDSGEFWFFDPVNWETIDRAVEEEHSGAYHFLLEVAGGGEDVPVIIGSLPNIEDDQKRPPMVLFYWGTKFPAQTNQSNLSFVQRLSQSVGWARVSGLPADIQVVEFAHPTPCPTSTPGLSSGGDSPTATDTPQPNRDSQTPTNTLSLIIKTPKPEKTRPTPTNTLEPSRTPRPSKPSPTPAK